MVGRRQSFMQPSDAVPYERLGVAFAVMLTNPGIPLIYYGDEVGLAGGGDPDNRRAMPWSDSQLNSHQQRLRDDIRALAKARGENPVLTRGSRQTLSSSADTWVYQRVGCDEPSVVVAINRADDSRNVSIPAGSYTDLLSGATVMGGDISLDARSFLVYRAE